MSIYDILPFCLAIVLECFSPLIGHVEGRYLSDALKKRYPEHIGDDEVKNIVKIIELQEDRARFFVPYVAAVVSFLLIFLADSHNVTKLDVAAIITMIIIMVFLRLILELPDPYSYHDRFHLPFLRGFSFVSLATLAVNVVIIVILRAQMPSNMSTPLPAATPTITAPISH